MSSPVYRPTRRRPAARTRRQPEIPASALTALDAAHRALDTGNPLAALESALLAVTEIESAS